MMNLNFARATGETSEPEQGEIKLYGPEAFAGMRTAGRLAAEALDEAFARALQLGIVRSETH